MSNWAQLSRLVKKSRGASAFSMIGWRPADNGCHVHSMACSRKKKKKKKKGTWHLLWIENTCSDTAYINSWRQEKTLQTLFLLPLFPSSQEKKKKKKKTHSGRSGVWGNWERQGADWQTGEGWGAVATLPGLPAHQREIAIIEQGWQRVADSGPVLISKGVGA